MFIKRGVNSMTEENLRSFAAAINSVLNSVSFLILENTDSEDYKSSYDLETRTVFIDSKYIDGTAMTNQPTFIEKKAIAALAHEKRHIYQSDNITKKWKSEFDNYKKPEDGLEDYLLQEIEVDANAFSRIIQEHFFDEHFSFEGAVESAVESRAEELRVEYGKK
jgi:hypothetical protein